MNHLVSRHYFLGKFDQSERFQHRLGGQPPTANLNALADRTPTTSVPLTCTTSGSKLLAIFCSFRASGLAPDLLDGAPIAAAHLAGEPKSRFCREICTLGLPGLRSLQRAVLIPARYLCGEPIRLIVPVDWLPQLKSGICENHGWHTI